MKAQQKDSVESPHNTTDKQDLGTASVASDSQTSLLCRHTDSSPNVRDETRVIVHSADDGFLVKIDGVTMMRFDSPLEPYIFSSAHSAFNAGKQRLSTNTNTAKP